MSNTRYSNVAILLHWLMAMLLIGLLAVGKLTASIPDDDPLAFVLIQWHKSFGIVALFLILLRVLWRFTHKPPPEPSTLPAWQSRASSLVHLALYGLMVLIPLSGWVMVSTSPLGIPTLLFNVVEWPHIGVFEDASNRESISGLAHQLHELLANLMILALIAHIGAALKHRFIDRDTILQRMLPGPANVGFRRLRDITLAAAFATAAGISYINASASGPGDATRIANGAAAVEFVASVNGSETPGSFVDAKVSAVLGDATESERSLEATVPTATVNSSNPQVAAALPDKEWFDAEGFPEARFESTTIERIDDERYDVTGELTIKEHSESVNFVLTVDIDDKGERAASGEFTVDRRDFDIGLESQPDDDTVGYDVTIRFQFALE